jgi:hypothetical protein
LGIGLDKSVKTASSLLRIDHARITFIGCKNSPYLVWELDEADSYALRYPDTKDQAHIGPIVHELAHLHQFKLHDGLSGLRRAHPDSRRIELAADFMAGVIFQKMTSVDSSAYLHGLSVMGLYREENFHAHGSPEERTAAFRRGLHFKFSDDVTNLDQASLYFHEDVYDEITAN